MSCWQMPGSSDAMCRFRNVRSIPVTKACVHPSYKAPTGDNVALFDIALLELAAPPGPARWPPGRFADFVQLDAGAPAQSGSNLTIAAARDGITIAGFGKTDKQRPILEGMLPLNIGTYKGVIAHGDILELKNDKRYSSTCFGDSGGPAYLGQVKGYGQGEQPQLLGIISTIERSASATSTEPCSEQTARLSLVGSKETNDWICRVTGLGRYCTLKVQPFTSRVQ